MDLTIDRFEGDRAILRTNAGQELIVPIHEIPATARKGDALRVSFGTDAETTDDRTSRAKDILNEILGDREN